MYRNFYNLLKSNCFLGLFSWFAVWNNGIVECCKAGYGKRKKVYSTKNVESTFYGDARQTSIFCFCPFSYTLLRKNQSNYIRFDSPNPPFHYSRTHDSNIPEFHHSNWGEAPKFEQKTENWFELSSLRSQLK